MTDRSLSEEPLPNVQPGLPWRSFIPFPHVLYTVYTVVIILPQSPRNIGFAVYRILYPGYLVTSISGLLQHIHCTYLQYPKVTLAPLLSQFYRSVICKSRKITSEFPRAILHAYISLKPMVMSLLIKNISLTTAVKWIHVSSQEISVLHNQAPFGFFIWIQLSANTAPVHEICQMIIKRFMLAWKLLK